MDHVKTEAEIIAAQAETIADQRHTIQCYAEEQARLEAQIPDNWLEEERNRTTRNGCARRMWAERKAALAELADINPKSRMRARLLRIRRDKWRATLRAVQRETFPQEQTRCMRKVAALMAYASSPFDDRGSCGYGDHLSDMRYHAMLDAKRGFAIAQTLDASPHLTGW